MAYDEEPTGIPTRAIHEAYLDVQRALKQFRRASDAGAGPARDRAHGDVQDAAITLYEMLRPHIRHAPSVDAYWDGAPPDYPRTGEPPDPDDGTAVLSWQTHHDTVGHDALELNGAESPADIEGLREWHAALPMAETARVRGVQSVQGGVLVSYHTYTMGLRHIDNWETEFTERETSLGGFMAGKTTTTTDRRRVPIEQLQRASRELGAVMDKLGMHARVESDQLATDEL